VYRIGRREKVVPLDSLPLGDTGAPLPLLVASDDELRIAYISRGDSSTGEVMVTVTFDSALAHMFGWPNDEALSGHPLARAGLSRMAPSRSTIPRGSAAWSDATRLTPTTAMSTFSCCAITC